MMTFGCGHSLCVLIGQKVGFWQCSILCHQVASQHDKALRVLSMRMSDRHHVDMAVMFKPCSFKPARVPGSKYVFAGALKMFQVMSRHDFHHGHHIDIKQTIWKHCLQSSVLPQIFWILGIFFTTGGVDILVQLILLFSLEYYLTHFT